MCRIESSIDFLTWEVHCVKFTEGSFSKGPGTRNSPTYSTTEHTYLIVQHNLSGPPFAIVRGASITFKSS